MFERVLVLLHFHREVGDSILDLVCIAVERSRSGLGSDKVTTGLSALAKALSQALPRV